MFRPSCRMIDLMIAALFFIPGTYEQCAGEVKVITNRTSSTCTVQTIVRCHGVSRSTVSRQSELCDLLGISEGCAGAECSRTWDLINDVCQTPGSTQNVDSTILQTSNDVGTLTSGNSTGSNWTGLTRDLIQAIRSQSLLGALVGVLMLVIIVLTTAWVWTCCVLKKRWGPKEDNTATENSQASLTPEQMRIVNNPAYVCHNDTNVQGQVRIQESSTYISARKSSTQNASDRTYY